MQQLLKEILETNGYDVYIVSNGREGVDYYKVNRERISLVILDIMLPEMDGREVLDEMKKFNGGLKIFFCTGFGSLVEIQSLVEKENLYLLQKPFSPEELLALVEEVMNQD